MKTISKRCPVENDMMTEWTDDAYRLDDSNGMVITYKQVCRSCGFVIDAMMIRTPEGDKYEFSTSYMSASVDS